MDGDYRAAPAPAKLKIAGAWTGALDVRLDTWTLPMLRAEVARRSGGADPACINLICGGKVLREGGGGGSGGGDATLLQLGIKSNAKVLATCVSADRRKALNAEAEAENASAAAEAEQSKKLNRICRNAKRPILEEPLKEKKKLRLYKTSYEVKEERKEEETQTHKESEVQEEKTQEENQRVYEYTSGEDDDYVRPDGKRRRTRDEWALYYKQVKESEGFDVDPSPDTFEFGLTALMNFEDEDLIRCTKSSIEQFNQENATNYEFVKIEKTTCIVAAGFWYNITFQAIDGGGSSKTFQAKVFYGISGSIRVSFCRLKPTTS